MLLGSLRAQETSGPPREVNTFAYPRTLTPDDKPSVNGMAIEIKSDTTLIWVDLAPGARYGHPTELLLIQGGFSDARHG